MTVAGFVLAHALYLAAGSAVVFALGFVRLRVVEIILATGLAYLVGVALVTTLLIALLVVGVPVTGVTFWVVALLVVVVGAGIGLRARGDGSGPSLPVPWRDGERLDRIALCVLVAVACAWLGWQAVESHRSFVGFDAAHIWTFKATALTAHDKLPLEIADNQIIAAPSFAGEDYPILEPVFMSTIFRQMGGPQPEGVPVELWLLTAAWVLAIAFLLFRTARNGLWPVALVAVVPSTTAVVVLSNVDSLLAIFCAAGACAAGLWVVSGARRDVVLAAALLGGAANLKAEGLAFAGLVLLSAGVARTAPRAWGQLKPWAVGLGVLVAFVLPWRIWLAIHTPPQNQPSAPLSDAIRPGFLTDRADQLDAGLQALLRHVADQGRFAWVVPAFLVVAVAALWDPALRRLAGFYLGAVGLTFAALAWVYWTTLSPNVPGYISTTADRILLSAVFTAAVGLAHLASTFDFAASGRAADGDDAQRLGELA